jgi:hypothetical protein
MQSAIHANKQEVRERKARVLDASVIRRDPNDTISIDGLGVDINALADQKAAQRVTAARC